MTCHSKVWFVLLFFTFSIPLIAQDTLWLLSLNAAWDDTYHEWDFYYETPDEYELEGEIEATWAHLNDWSDWDYRIGDHTGTIRQKWKRNDQVWELWNEHNVTTIQTRWSNDYSEWIIRYNNDIKIHWLAESFDDGNIWFFEDEEFGVFEFYTEFINDPRDWIIYDDTIPELPLDIKIACSFIAMFRSTTGFRN